ncbi:MATE family efflux transporter [Fusibacter sp. 3D3]|uniref:MATE family efflux transporter n=1 Tax=Fusibacter sp. 3D3 TaxID=1048380 RepID=UPI00085330EA|nr:MATE family efflux transporter [Fusibacter sp. 3D3]GAU78846.1 multi antimicrobial extrusion protein Na(+)/drug antiporter [Fusibacter sp. 3D3]
MRKGNMTEGVIWKEILLFALPLLGTSFIQQLYNTVDLIFVGNVLGKEATAAVGASTLFVTCLVGFFSGLSIGSGVVASQVFGGGDNKELQKVIHSAIVISLICGGLIMGIGLAFSRFFLKWVNTPYEIRPIAIQYMRVFFVSSIPLITYNMGAGIIRALGNARAPMYIQLIGGIMNVVMNALFLLVFKLGVTGVAMATLFSQSLAAILVLSYLRKQSEMFEFTFKKLRLHIEYFYKILKIGVPVGLQALVITLSNVFVQYNVNQLGIDALAAFTAYFKVELLIYLPIIAFGQAITTFSSQNIGAKVFNRVKEGTFICMLMGLGVTVVLSGVVLLWGRQLFGLINRDLAVLDLGVKIISRTVPFYWLYLIIEVLGGSIRGGAKTFPPMLIILSNICVLRTVLLYILTVNYKGIESIAVTYPITWASTALFMLGYYLKSNWMGKKLSKEY